MATDDTLFSRRVFLGLDGKLQARLCLGVDATVEPKKVQSKSNPIPSTKVIEQLWPFDKAANDSSDSSIPKQT